MKDCGLCPFRTIGSLRRLSGEALARLTQSFTTHHYRPGEVVFSQDSPVESFYFLCTGTLKLVRECPEGKQTIVEILSPCGQFGEVSLAKDAVQSVTAEAVEPAAVNAIPRKVMAEFLHREPELLFEMVENLSASLREARVNHADFSHQPVRLRALNLLTNLFDRYGRRVNGYWELGVPLARSEIAEMLGATTETTIRTLAKLQREGHLRLGRRRIYLPDPEAFRLLSERENRCHRNGGEAGPAGVRGLSPRGPHEREEMRR